MKTEVVDIQAWLEWYKKVPPYVFYELQREYRVVLLAKPYQLEDMVHNNDVVTVPTFPAYSYQDAVHTAHQVSNNRDKWCVVGTTASGLWTLQYIVP